MYGTVWCRDCKRTKKFFAEQRIDFRYVDIDADADGMAYVERANDGKHVIPTIEFPDGSLLIEPSNAELAAKLGIQTSAKSNFYDLIVVGSGPAGLTAAIYAAREGIDTLVIERAGVGGQTGMTERLDNFPGFPEGVSGSEFADRLRAQALRFGVGILAAQDVSSIGTDEVCRAVRTADGREYRAWAVLLALGSTYRRLGIPGEDAFIGAGVHFCATCDGAFYRDRDVMVIGGGNCGRGKPVPHQVRASHHDRHPGSRTDRQPRRGGEGASSPGHRRDHECNRRGIPGGKETRSGQDQEPCHRRADHNDAGRGLCLHRPLTEQQPGRVPGGDRHAGLHRDRSGHADHRPGNLRRGDVRSGSTNQAASAAGEGAAAALAIRRYLEPLAGGMPCREQVRQGPLAR